MWKRKQEKRDGTFTICSNGNAITLDCTRVKAPPVAVSTVRRQWEVLWNATRGRGTAYQYTEMIVASLPFEMYESMPV